MQGNAYKPEELLCKIIHSHTAVLYDRCENYEIEESLKASVDDAVDIARSHDWDWDEWSLLHQEISYEYLLTGTPVQTNDAELQKAFSELKQLSQLCDTFIEKLRPHTAEFMN